MCTLLHLKLPAAFLGSFVVQSFNLFYQSHFEDWSLMANPEAHETDHRRRKVFELKMELQRLFKTILDEDDYGMQVTDEVLRVLSCLKEFQLKKSHSISADCLDVPEVFRCPISGEIVADPVVLANGQEIPPKFVMKMKFGDELTNIATLTVPNARVWQV
ncbi:U-box domain-containing protein 9-like isoform X1 [Pistacia vera]|uniref:U-box domain-containing protein 9-like isoform X1 n=1 Tax=Pistacia vera TaxID=55513 RepID=UPI001263CF84|nr:U-box domain-containing protein 9-like isoform X1 [Pistacia vera]